MKKFRKTSLRAIFGLASVVLLAQGCIILADYGPPGRDGRAYFGIDYDYDAPYSYWDNNPSVPVNPFFGEYYRSHPGTFNFEYFVNPFEYWYGTYSLRINSGQPGQPYGEPGLDGTDTYLLMICNPDGFYFEGWDDCGCTYREADGTLIIERQEGEFNFRIEMKKAHIKDRPPVGDPKWKQ